MKCHLFLSAPGRVCMFLSGLYLSILACAGCGRRGGTVEEPSNEGIITTECSPQKTEIFASKVEVLVSQLDAKEDLVRKSAYELCCEIRAEPSREVRLQLLSLYTNAIHRMSIGIDGCNLDDKSSVSRLDTRLRNNWHIAEWASAALFDETPGDLQGWGILVSGVRNYQSAIAVIETHIKNTSDKRRLQRLGTFKRHLSITLESKVWTLGKIYQSQRNKMTSKQRDSIRQLVSETLGIVPPELAKESVMR